MKIYTKTGDAGETGLFGGQRVTKDALRVHAYGTVDECNAVLGVARAALADAELSELIGTLQEQLFTVGADLATPGGSPNIPRVGAAEIAFLEATIDRLEADLAPLRQFILPGGSAAAAQLHVARTVCRRAERWAVGLAREESLNLELLAYLNRLSDLLFVLARAANSRAGIDDTPWNSPRLNKGKGERGKGKE
jgi:cob(I)alamin adenosyltransferase